MTLRNIYVVLLMSVFPLVAHAQDATLRGAIRDADTQEPLIAANIVVSELQRGAISNVDGNFSVENIPPGTYTLQASYIGYRSFEQAVSLSSGQTLDLEIELEPDVFRTEEVIVTGQGIGLERQRLSTATYTVSAAEIERIPTPRLEQALQAQLPTVQLGLRSGLPGTTSLIRSRGINSAAVSSTPVIYVDGIRVDNLNARSTLSANINGNPSDASQTSALADLPIDNIERIEFLNGGAATTLYGSDAANGVIQIFTKKGNAAQSSLTLGVGLGSEVGTEEYFFFDRTGDLLYEPGLVQDYQISGLGGGDGWGYSFSGRVRDSDGFRIDNSGSTQYDVRTSLNAEVSPIVDYSGSLAYAKRSYERARDGNGGSYTPLWITEGSFLTLFGFDADLDALPQDEFSNFEQFVNSAERLLNNEVEVDRFQMSHSLDIKPISSLTLRALGGLDYRVSNERAIYTREYLSLVNSQNPGSIDDFERRFLSLTLEGTAQHRAQLGNVSLISSLGTQFFRDEDDQILIEGDDVRDGTETISGAGITTGDQFKLRVANYGFYALQNAGFFDRYFLEYGLRVDGNSAFGDDVGLQVYPKVGGSYVLSNESFYRSSALVDVLSYARLRANFGVAGNFPTPFADERTIAFTSFLGSSVAGLGQIGNEDLEPERTYTWEIGADLGLLRDRIRIGFTYYDAETRDALFLVPVAPSASLQNNPGARQLRNVGEIVNRGVEITSNIQILQTSQFSLLLNASVNTLHNEVTDSGGSAPFSIGGFSSRTIQNVVEEGQPVGYIRGNQALLAADGGYDGTEGESFLGSTLPDAFGTLSLDFRWNDLSLFASADWQAGAQAHNFNDQFRYLRGTDFSRLPDPVAADEPGWLDVTNFFVQDTDFLKVRLISLSYSLPARLYAGRAKDVSIGFSVQNPFNFVNSTFDPEAQTSGAETQGGPESNGVGYGVDPAPRVFLGTFKVRF